MKYVLIGGSGANNSGSKLFVKSSFGPYVTELIESGFIDSCYFYTTDMVCSLSYSLPLSKAGCINNRLTLISLLIKLLFKKTNFLLFLPNSLLFASILLTQKILLRDKRLLCFYVGGEFYKQNNTIKQKLRSLLYKIIFSQADFLICRGKSIINDMPKHVKKIETVPICRPLTLQDHVNRDIKLQKFSTLEKFRIGFMGRNSPGKGLDILSEALNIILSNHPKLISSVNFAGFDQENLLNSNVSMSRSLLSISKFSGWVDTDLTFNEYFASIDLLVMPSRSVQAEGVPRVIHESLSRGSPVIASNINGVINNHADDVLTFEESNVTSLVKSLLSLQSLEARIKLASQAIKYNMKFNCSLTPARQHINFLTRNEKQF